MRAHGVSDFQDPPALGGGPPVNGPAAGGPGTKSYLGNSFDPNSPTVRAAEQACQKYAAGLAQPVTPAAAAQVQAQQLEYAQCMRSHGVPDFPDPSATGGFSIPSSIDENSSTFQAAERACESLQPSLPGKSGS